MAKKSDLEGAEVHVVVYSTRHGNDIWVRSTEESALKVVDDLIKDTLDEFEEDLEAPEAAKEIRKLLAAGRIKDAARIWQDEQIEKSMSPETISLAATRIDQPDSVGA